MSSSGFIDCRYSDSAGYVHDVTHHPQNQIRYILSYTVNHASSSHSIHPSAILARTEPVLKELMVSSKDNLALRNFIATISVHLFHLSPCSESSAAALPTSAEPRTFG
jgi:hypothetical protein